MKKALIIGITGRDWSYLARLLIKALGLGLLAWSFSIAKDNQWSNMNRRRGGDSPGGAPACTNRLTT